MADYKDLDSKVIKLSKQIVRMCTEAGSGHPSSALSLIHLTVALMYRAMHYDPRNPWNTSADRLVLSEGHAVPAIYAAYCELGGVVGYESRPSQLRFDDALTLRDVNSVIDGHPNPAIGFPFFDAATGSLGQGISVAAGLAWAARNGGPDRTIYVIAGDGESREGQIWEALDFIADKTLTNVRVIFNCNGQGQSDYVSSQQSVEALAAKVQAFGCDVQTIDGHNWDEIFQALAAEAAERPLVVLAKTVKGWGVTELQQHTYHGKVLKSDRLGQAIANLDAKGVELGVTGLEDVDASELTVGSSVSRHGGGAISAGSFADALTAAGLSDALARRSMATRQAYGAALAALGADQRVVALDADVSNSTFSNLFAAQHPDRYIECRIAEQNMVSAAVGLSAAGKIPFVSTFAKFLVRGYDQFEMAVMTDANVKFCGSHAGVSLAADGPSQMGLADLAFMRAFSRCSGADGAPAVRIFHPSDAVSAFKLTELMANLDGICYMRTHRPSVEFIYGEDDEFTASGFKHLVDGEDLVIVSSGYMVHVAREAVKVLEDEAGLSVGLIDAYSIPVATEEILRIGDDCRGQILVVEDNYAGGIAAEIASAAACSDFGVMVESMYVRRAPKSAKTPQETLALVKLGVSDIVAAAQAMFDQSD